MKAKPIVNVTASIAARIKNWASKNHRSYQHALTRYAVERFLARLEASRFANQFVLKGGNLFVVWFAGKDYRPTMDTDFLFCGHEMAANELQAIFSIICSSLPTDDGLRFDSTSIETKPIREETAYGGWRVTLKVFLGTIKIPLQFDIGFGDAVTPAPETVTYPSLLNDYSPKLQAYPMVTMLAEKCAIMIELGFANSRMKDFYDLWMVLHRFTIPEDLLKVALLATFKRRGTPLGDECPLCFTEAFATDEKKSTQWQAYLRKNNLQEDCPTEFAIIARFITSKLLHLLLHI